MQKLLLMFLVLTSCTAQQAFCLEASLDKVVCLSEDDGDDQENCSECCGDGSCGYCPGCQDIHWVIS